MQIAIPWNNAHADGGEGMFLSVPTPNEIDPPPSISVGTGTEDSYHAGTQCVAYNLMNEVLVQMYPLCLQFNFSPAYLPYLS